MFDTHYHYNCNHVSPERRTEFDRIAEYNQRDYTAWANYTQKEPLRAALREVKAHYMETHRFIHDLARGQHCLGCDKSDIAIHADRDVCEVFQRTSPIYRKLFGQDA